MGAFTLKPTNNVDYEMPAPGTYPAVLVALLDLGTHENEYQGKTTIARKVFLAWELTSERKTDGSNFVLGREYTLSFAKKSNLRALVEKWRGKEFGADEAFDLGKLAGQPCLLSVVLNDNGYTKVEGVSQPPKGMKIEKPTHSPIMWEIGSVTPFPTDEWLPYSFGKPLHEVINRSNEYKAGTNGKIESPKTAEEDAAVAKQLRDQLDSQIPF
jgi:hypothetical protein